MPGSEADPGHPVLNRLVLRVRRRERQQEIDVGPELVGGLEALFPRLPLDRRRSCGRLVAEVGAERLELVLLLDLFDVGQILGVEQLGACQRAEELGVTLDDALYALGQLTFPRRRCQQHAHAVVAVFDRSGIVEHETPEIVPLTGVEALRFDLRQGQDPGLGAQIDPGVGVRRVVVRRNDVGVLRRGRAQMEPLAEAAAVGLRTVASIAWRYIGAVHHHQRPSKSELSAAADERRIAIAETQTILDGWMAD